MQAVDAVDVDAVDSLDQALRRRWVEVQGIWRPPYGGSKEASLVNLLPDSGSGRVAGLMLMASHCNGFVRQRAVEELIEARAIRSLEMLTLRLCDWVPAVRRVALEGWSGLLVDEHAGRVVEALPLIRRVLDRAHVDREQVSRVLTSFLASTAGHQALRAGIENSRRAVARASLEAGLELDPVPERLFAVALQSRDELVRLPGRADVSCTGR